MRARSIRSPRANTVHGLTASRGCARLVVVRVRAAVSVVSRVSANLVQPALLVDLDGQQRPPILRKVIKLATSQSRGSGMARSVGSPRTNAVHRLRATRGRALLVVVVVWTTLTTMSSMGGVLVQPAPPVLVVRSSVRASSIRSPRSSTVHRLRAATLRTRNVVVRERACVTVMGGVL